MTETVEKSTVTTVFFSENIVPTFIVSASESFCVTVEVPRANFFRTRRSFSIHVLFFNILKVVFVGL